MMKYAVALPCGGECADPKVLARFARIAEDSGWDGVLLEDYIVYSKQPGCPTVDVWVALAAMAIATTHIRVGTAVTAASRRRPWKLAREAVSIDHLSEGRLTLGLGVGDPADDGFARVSEERDPRVRAERLDETLTILAGLFSGEPFTFLGKHFQLQDITFLPTPVQPNGIPVWIGGGWPAKRPLRRAAGQSGFAPYRRSPDDPFADAEDEINAEDVGEIARRISEIRGGLSDYDIVVGGRRRRPDWDAERAHIQAVTDSGATWWQEWIPMGPAEQMQTAIARGPLR